jgi:type IV pilus assembly protein PilX
MHTHYFTCKNPPAQQRGVVLVIALIVLVAMTLAAIALVRSVDTTNIIAGNLSFHQAAVHAGDTGTESAVNWLETQTSNTLAGPLPANGYSPTWNPKYPLTSGESWDDYWNNVLAPQSVQVMFDNNGVPSAAGANATDAAGNTVLYAIQRMCNDNAGVNCLVVPANTVLVKGNSQDISQMGQLQVTGQHYYRITTKITGPRNTVSYVQAIIASN